jgi:hypothetical protein
MVNPPYPESNTPIAPAFGFIEFSASIILFGYEYSNHKNKKSPICFDIGLSVNILVN